MQPSKVLKEMNELRESWRKQGFKFTTEHKLRYEKLLELRRARVKEMHKNGQVHKGGAKTATEDK